MERPDPTGAGFDPRRDLFGYEERATIAFNQIHEPSGQRIKYEKVAPDIGPVDVDEIVKGFKYAKGEYVLLDEDEI